MQEQIERDLKAAMLAGDKVKTEILRGLKNSLQYEAVNLGSADRKLNDEQVQKVLTREAKKRQEAADLYRKNNEVARAETELAEKQVIDDYLPEQIDELELNKIVEAEVANLENPTIKDMGRVIGAVKTKTAGRADGSAIAKLVKEKLSG